jgi:hypothetical protein
MKSHMGDRKLDISWRLNASGVVVVVVDGKRTLPKSM